MADMPKGAEIVAAMDADEPGRRLAGMIGEFFSNVAAAGRADLRFTAQEPEGAKDWNDVLRLGAKDTFPAAPLLEP